MKLRSIMSILLVTALLAGCASRGTVLCITPTGDFQPNTGAELLEEFNRQMPFSVHPRQFLCKPKSGKLVGWVVIKTDKQIDIAKQTLRDSSRLNSSQVEALTPETAKAIQANWRQSLAVKAPPTGP